MTLAEKRDASGAVVLYAVYRYDVFGNRIEKAVDWDGDGPNAAVVTRYVLDGWNNMKPTPIGNEHFDIYAELDGTNQLIARYLHGDEFDQTFARVDLRAANASERVLWYLTDHLNSVRLVLDESGTVLDQIAYDAFGNIVAQLNPLFDNPLLFTSREFDAETGLVLQPCPLPRPDHRPLDHARPLGFAAGDANLYRYVGNTPTLLVDPSGNIAWFVAVPLVMSVAGFTWLTGSTALVSYRTTGSWSDASTWAALWDGLRLGIQANVNGLASAARSLLTLGVWNEPWEVWAVDEVDRPYYNDAFLAARFGWELLPTAGIARLTQIPGQMGRWGRWALGWDAGQNAVQAGRGGWDIDQHGLTWGNSLQVVGSLLGLGGNYATWRRLPAGGASARTSAAAPSTPTTPAAVSTETVAPRPPTAAPSTPTTRAAAAETETAAARPPTTAPNTPTTRAAAADEAATGVAPVQAGVNPRSLNIHGSMNSGVSPQTVNGMRQQLRTPQTAEAFWRQSVAQDGPITIYEINGQRYIFNGNHRYQAALAEGAQIPEWAIRIEQRPNYSGPLFRLDQLDWVD
jgi:RHS repeat-associated protein